MPNEIAQPQRSVEALEAELTTLAGHLNAGNYRFLRLLAEFDRRGGYSGFRIASCAHWLSWKCGIGLVAAREKVRVARALEQLPLISEAMRLGKLSYCKARAITRVASATNEQALLSIAENGTVSHVEKTVRLYQRGERAEELNAANQRYEDRYLQCYFDEHGQLVLRAQLPSEQGALFMKALQASADALWEAQSDSCEALRREDAHSAATRRADALSLMAETALAHGPSAATGAERHLVTVHVSEEVLRDPIDTGTCQVEDQAPLPPATVRRLCCDGNLVAIVEDEDGLPQSASRRTRVVPTAMRRALTARDGGCRFPGCCNTRYVDAHHIIHWADGGETTLDNLTLLCRKHHRAVHEYGFQIERVGRELRFLHPDGRHVPDVPRSAGVGAAEGCEALHRAHASEDLQIEAATAVCRWIGDAPNYDWIIAGLQDRRAPRRASTPAPTLHMEQSDLDHLDHLDDVFDREGQRILQEQRETTERMRLMQALWRDAG